MYEGGELTYGIDLVNEVVISIFPKYQYVLFMMVWGFLSVVVCDIGGVFFFLLLYF